MTSGLKVLGPGGTPARKTTLVDALGCRAFDYSGLGQRPRWLSMGHLAAQSGRAPSG